MKNMYRKYVLTALLILGFGVASTLAFTLIPDTDQDKVPNFYDVDGTASTATITKIRTLPKGGQGTSQIRLKITTSSTSCELYIDVIDNDGSPAATPSAVSAVGATANIVEGVIEVTSLTSTSISMTVTGQNYESGYFEDIESIFISIVDT